MIKEIDFENKHIIIVGTAHVSSKNRDQVKNIILEKKPTAVCVELDTNRLYALMHPEEQKKPKFSNIFKTKQKSVFLLNYILSGLQKGIAKKFNITPGEEMLSAVEGAKEVGAKIYLVDRDINITLQKLLKRLTFGEKVKVIFGGLFIPKKEVEKINIDRLMSEVENEEEKSEIIEEIMKLFTKRHKKLKEILIDERDEFIAYNLQVIPEETIVVVVGAGHMEGIIKNLENRNINLRKILTI
ncbi:MAG: TraB family protein [archaeon]|jgi:pheromone shutdown-related protein TraB